MTASRNERRGMTKERSGGQGFAGKCSPSSLLCATRADTSFLVNRSEVKGSDNRDRDGESDTRSVLQNALSDMQDSDWDALGSVVSPLPHLLPRHAC